MTLPTGFVTFLFTDIEGSTRLWEEVPEAMRVALPRHDALLRSSAESHGGRVFKTIGDAFCVVFRSPIEAVEAAVAAQFAIQSESWPNEVGALRVRMAIHTAALSDLDERDGDYFGPPLNRVARLTAAGHGGQVLVSQSARSRLPDNLPSGGGLRDLQLHRLKDLLLPERIWQLEAPGLPAEFPPLRSLQEFANNLPSQLTTFVGRKSDLDDICRFLSQAGTDGCSARLLTLVGSGGSGKTRLALHAAADRVEAYRDGVWVAELAPLTDPSLVPNTVARVVGLRDEPRRSPTEVLVEHLSARNVLLILDNCEHLVEAAAGLASDLLRNCPRLTMVATSREPLRVSGETLQRVEPLLLPAADRVSTNAATLMELDCVRLFVERARLVAPSFRLEAENAHAVAQICRRLDGIPLAIELAAALVRNIRPEQIAERLDDRFRLLTVGDRTDPRHETLQAVIQWSYDLLAPDERRLFGRLGIFAGSWSLEATEAVCSDGPESPAGSLPRAGVLPRLLSLADKSLVAVQREEGAATDRFRLLETVRDFARDRLKGAGEYGAYSARHAAHYLELAETAEPELSGPDQAEWLNRLEAEHDNLRAAISASRESRVESRDRADPRLSTLDFRLTGALWRFWHVRGHWSEGRRYLEETVQLGSSTPGPTPESGGTSLARAKALHGLGTIAYTQGDYGPAKQWLSEALKIRRKLKDAFGVAATLNNLGAVARDMGDVALARKRFEESLRIRRRIGDRSGEADGLVWLGNLANDQRRYADAKSCFMESLALYRTVGHKKNLGSALRMLGVIALEQRNFSECRAWLEEGLAMVEEVGDSWWAALFRMNLSTLARMEGQFETARELAEASCETMRALGDRHCTADCLVSLGAVALAEGRVVEEATGRFFLEAFSTYRAIGNNGGTALALEGLAAYLASRGDAEQAARLLGVSAALRETHSVEAEEVDRALQERAMSSVRSALSELKFVGAFSQGRSVPLEEIAVFAKRVLASSSTLAL